MRNRKRRNDAFLPAALLLIYHILAELVLGRIHLALVFSALTALILFREHFDGLLNLSALALCAYSLVMTAMAFGKATPLELLIRLFDAFFSILLLLGILLPSVLPVKPYLCIMGIIGLGASILPQFLEDPVLLNGFFPPRLLLVLNLLSPLLYYGGLVCLASCFLEPLIPFRSRGSLINSPADPGRMLLLSFVTLGLYRLIWNYRLCTDVGILKGQRSTALRDSLCLYFVPFYGAYWYYVHAVPRLRNAKASLGQELQNEPFLYLLFSLPGLGLVNQVLLQQELNGLALEHYMVNPVKSNVRNMNRKAI